MFSYQRVCLDVVVLYVQHHGIYVLPPMGHQPLICGCVHDLDLCEIAESIDIGRGIHPLIDAPQHCTGTMLPADCVDHSDVFDVLLYGQVPDDFCVELDVHVFAVVPGPALTIGEVREPLIVEPHCSEIRFFAPFDMAIVQGIEIVVAV